MENFVEKMKKFFANKSVGYWIAIADAVLALIFGIVYMTTYKGAIGNNASGNVPESVGIFMLAGAVVEIVLCVLPQYVFIHFIAIVLFGLSLFKEVFLVPDFIAGLANGIEYNGGSARMNIFYLVAILVIMISAIVAIFLGFYKSEEEANADFKAIKGTLNLAKIGGGAAITIAAILVSTISVSSLTKGTGGSSNNNVVVKEKFNPITDEIKTLADQHAPENDPKDVVYEKKAKWDYTASGFTSLSAGAATRTDHYLVYLFEGAYSEGYQGNYNEYYTYLYLWDDGLYTGKSNSETFKGYWYNDMDGDGTADCLNLVSNSEKYASIVCQKASGFYNYQAYVFMNPGWGSGRSIIVAGYMVYDTIALAIDTTTTGLTFKKGDMFKTSQWKLNRILSNLNYGAVFNTPDGASNTRTKWTVPSGLLVDDKFDLTGEFEIKASWNGLETSVTITITE